MTALGRAPVACDTVRVPSDMPSRRRPQRTRRRSSNRGRIALLVVFAALVILFLSARGIAGFYTDYLWFQSLGYTGVWSGVLGAKIALAALFTAVFFALLMVNLVLAGKLAPRFRAPGPEEDFLERYQNAVGRRSWLVNLSVSLVFGLIAGVGVSGQWRDWLLFTNRVDFGVDDPQFDLDIGFYVFQLPFLSFVVSWLFASIVIIFIVTTVAHYLNGGIRIQVPGERVTPQVKAHLSVLLAVLALLKAAGYWLQRYGLTLSTRGTVDGATYTGVKAQLPAVNLLTLISLGAAVLLILNIWQRGWRLPVIAVGLWGLVAVVAGAAYPEIVQRFQVEPSESSREQPYIERNIAATRAALGLSGLETVPYTPEPLAPEALTNAQEQLASVRLLDPNIVGNAFQLLEGLQTFYRFTDLDVDRYEIDGARSQVVIASRELNSEGLPQNTWEARHLAYTHGYGVEIAPADRVRENGAPAFINLDPEAIGPSLTRPEVYFGEDLIDYAVVDTDRAEISANGNSTYEGGGGVGVGNFLRQVAFALRFSEPNLFFSGEITGQSRILYVRDVRERVELLAPFLEFDADPYPVLIDNQMFWIIDGYTTTDRYPYAQRAAPAGRAGSGLNGRFNYVRNSVKAVVDAYDGDVSFYVVDDTDPLARAYQKAFPELFKPASEVPAGFAEHFRYPEDMFRVQTTMWGRYHMTDPDTFYEQSDGWNVAQAPQPTQAANPDGARQQRIDPFYALMQLPDEQGQLGPQEFVLYRPFVPVSDDDSRRQLEAIMVASSDPGTYGRLRVFEMAPPTDEQLPPGPALVQSNIQSDATIAQQLTLLDQQGSVVQFGNQVIVPVDRSLLFITPLYVRASGAAEPPSLRFVVVTRSNERGETESVMGTTLQEALEAAFPGAEIPALDAQIVDANLNPTAPELGEPINGDTTSTTTAPSTSTPTTTGSPPAPAGTSVSDLLAAASAAFDAADAALATGDLATYEARVDDARRLIAQAETVASGGSTTTATTSAGSLDGTATTSTPDTTGGSA